MSNILFIYNWGTATGQALAPVAESKNIPLITNTQTPGVARNRQHVIRFINPAKDFAAALLNALRNRGYTRFAVVKTNLGYIDDLLEGMGAELLPGEHLELIDSYQPTDTDFRATVTKLKQSRSSYDAIGVFLISGQIGEFYRQLATQQLSAPTFGTDFFESNWEIAQAGRAIEGALYANLIVSDDFKQRYIKRFGNDTHLTYASNAYDFALLAATHADAQPEDVFEAFRNTAPRQGSAGTFHYRHSNDGDHYFNFPIGIKTIRNGRIQLVRSNNKQK